MKKYIDEENIKQLKNKMIYKSGDTVSIRYQGGGFITTGGQSLRFTLTLDKPITATKAKLVGFLTLRQEGKYIYGSAEENTSIESLNQNSSHISACGVTFNIEKNDGFKDAVNNHAVGVLFNGTIEFT